MKLSAFAKINWSLDITGVREDGYHLMDMVMQPVSISDEITLAPSGGLSISASGFPRVRADGSNLAYRAALALKNAAGYAEGASIHVQKAIPVGAGMGGGSADAAAVLFGLNRLWGLNLSGSELEEIGLTLGADVPFCLRGGLARTRGIGEILENYPDDHHFWLLVTQPCRGLSTGDVFRAYHESRDVVHPDTEKVLQALCAGDLALLSSSAGNVLEAVSAAIRPEISAAAEEMRRSGAVFASMTGSGSAVFGVYRNRNAAEKARTDLSRISGKVFLAHTQSDSIRILEEET